MKLLIASGTFHPDVGGPPTYLYGLADELVRRGHRLKVITYGESGGAYPYAVLRISRKIPIPLRLARFAALTLTEGRRADLLYVNDYGFPPAVANLLLRKPLVMKIVSDFAWEFAVRHGLVPHELGIEEFQPRRFGSSVERLRMMQTWYARRADLIIAPSEYVAAMVEGWGIRRHRIRVIYNAPIPLPDPPPDGAATTPSSRPDHGAFVVATIARLAPWKGVDVLVNAVAMARQRVPGLELLVIGDGDERARLQSLAAPLGAAVHFTGEVPHDCAMALLRQAGALALCSAYEGLSHVLLEAMEARKPIVASAVGGNRELVRDGENGLLVPYGDAGLLGDALVRLAQEPGLRQRLADQAGRDAEARAWPRLVDATLAVFDEALTRHGVRAT